MIGNTDRDPFPDAAALHALLSLLKLKHDPVIQEFVPQARTPQHVQTLRRSERVVESGSDVSQKALCSFHVGLFYLHWQESIGAAHRFQQAGRYWQITPLPPLICLASLAEGSAWHRACDDEAALVATIQAHRRLTRLTRKLYGSKRTEKRARLLTFLERLEGILKQTQVALQQSLDIESSEYVAPPTTNLGDE